MHTYNELLTDLKNMGISLGDKLLVHSSYKSLGEVEGGAETVIQALKDAVGEQGTLILPTFTFDYVHRKNPVFDVKNTASCVGYLTEVFRKSDGVIRSVHPTHSAAVWGKDKEYFVRNHRADNVCVGENSPLFKLKDAGGKILMIGCGIARNTLIHGVECFHKPPYAFRMDYTDPEYKREYVCIDYDNHVTQEEFFHVYMEQYGYDQDYNKLWGLMEIRQGQILDAESFLMDAATVWNTVLDKMKQEPYYFMKKRKEEKNG